MLRRVFVLHLLSLTLLTNAQVGIGTTTPNATAQLDIYSSSKGLLLPRLTTAQINNIVNPEPGLIVFNTTTKKFVGYGMGTPIGSIDNINAAGGGAWYLGFEYSNYGSGPYVVDLGQTFPIASSIGLKSISLWLPGFNNSNPGNVIVSVYTGNTPGSGTLVGTSIQFVSTQGKVDFNFSSALALTPGNYYFLVHAESIGMSGGWLIVPVNFLPGAIFQGSQQMEGPLAILL